MKASFTRLLHSTSRCIPHGSLGRFVEFPFLAPFYHIVSDEKAPHVDHLYSYRNLHEFNKDVDFLLQHYSPLTLTELLSHLKNERPLGGQFLFLSFDDGLRETFDNIAPILKQKGVPATFFVNTATLDNREMLYRHKASLLLDHLTRLTQKAAVSKATTVLAKHGVCTQDLASGLLSIRYAGKHILDEVAASLDFDFTAYLARRQPYLTTAQLNALISQGFSVGAHSVDHPPYGEITMEEQLRQTKESVNALTRTFCLNYRAFAFPFSDKGVSQRFFSQVRAEGLVQVLFGSSAYLIDEHYPLVIQRLGMEDQPHCAKDILRLAEVKFAVRLLAGKAGTRRAGS
jgi:peptidoglycan/xylan/chitin deacetylase (PgdA/CDA1 family)